MAAKRTTNQRTPDPARKPAQERTHAPGRRPTDAGREAIPAATRRYWLFKSEPSTFAWADLVAAPGRRTFWNGVRNYQARNLLRDEVQVGDGVLFYHSNVEPMAIVGTARVVRAGYPDHTAFDVASPYHDANSDPKTPTWFMVDIEAEHAFAAPLTRAQLAAEPALADMMLLRRGSRLSVQPVAEAEWRAILRLAGLAG